MDQSKLTAYREAAAAAKAGVLAMPSFINVPHIATKFIYTDIPTLATAVADLCAEVERLTAERSSLAKALQVVADMQWKCGYIRHQRSEAIEAEKILNDFLKVTHDDR